MKWSNIKWIFLREIRDQLRDRRTLFTIAVLPLILYPLLGMSFLQVAQFKREHQTAVLVWGRDALPEDPALLKDGAFAERFCPSKDSRLLELTLRDHEPEMDETKFRTTAEELISSGEFAAAVWIPRNFGSQLSALRQKIAEERAPPKRISSGEDSSETSPPATASQEDAAASSTEPGAIDPRQQRAKLLAANPVPEPELFVNTASDKSRIAQDRLQRVLRRWRGSVVDDNLRQKRVPVEATEPFGLVNIDVAQERSKRAAVWSKILPFVVLVWALTGAFYPAIDLCAGEKERGTLETLLCSPAERGEIVWGKLFTIMAFSMATSLLNMLSMGLTGAMIMSQIVQTGAAAELGIGSPPLASMGWIVLGLIPISALFSALALAIAAFARSSKEGQYYLMPLLMITLPLMVLPMLPTAELDLGTSLIPVSGMMLLLRALIEGQYMEALRFAVPVVGITSICCLLSIRWAVDQFNNESVLFRESERWDIGLWLKRMVQDRQDTPTLGEALFCGVLLLLIRFFASFFVGVPDSWHGFATTTVVTLLAFVAAPALLMTVTLTRNPRKTLSLNLPRLDAFVMAGFLAFLIHPAGIGFAEFVRFVYPFNDEVLTQMQSLQGLITGAPSLLAVVLVLALTPAVCEELAFRGFILSGLRHLGHKWAAILATSIFFGAAHGILQQSLTACALGMVIGYIAVQTGSVLPGILFHLIYNSLSLLMAMQGMQWRAEFPVLEWILTAETAGIGYRWPLLGVSLLGSVAVLLWFRSLPHEVSAEESLQKALDHQSAQPAID